MSESKSYIRFSSANPRLNFSFLYPGDWQVREVRGTDCDEVSIMGPRNREDTFSSALVVRVTPATEKAGQYTGLRELVADYLTQSSRLAGFRKTAQPHGSLPGVDTTEIEISYVLPLPVNTLNPKKTPIVERRIFFQKADHFYEAMYRAVEEDYYKYLEVFSNALRTFEFRDDATQ